jgi:membrane protein YdbS with pleckstrin-like domain
MEDFEHSKALKTLTRRRTLLNEVKVGAVAASVTAAAFFINGGFTSPIWASAAAAVVGIIACMGMEMRNVLYRSWSD